MIVDVSKESCIRAASDGDSDTVRRYFAQLETQGIGSSSSSSSSRTQQRQDKCDSGECGHGTSGADEPATPAMLDTANATSATTEYAKIAATSRFFFRNQVDMTHTLFAEAIENGHVAVVQTLLAPPARTCIEPSLAALLPELLVAAIEEDYPEIVECLLTLGGADANASVTSKSSSSSSHSNSVSSSDDSELDTVSPLCKAAELGSLEAAQLLVAHGADVCARHDRTGRTALHAAATQGDVDVVAFLLASGADVDAPDYARRETALVSAVKKGNSGVVARLIAANARLDVPNAFGSTALHVARVEGQREICALLEAAGAQVLEVPRTPRRV